MTTENTEVRELGEDFCTRGGASSTDVRTSKRAQDVMHAAGVRKAAYEQMARKALADAGISVDKVELMDEPEPEPIPRVEVREPAPKPEGRAIEVNASIEDHMTITRTPKAEFDKPLPKDRSFADVTGVPEWARGMSVGKHLRGVLFGKWDGAEREHEYVSRAMGGGGNGSNLIPSVYSSQIVDLARPLCQVMNAGASLIPMSARTVYVPAWTADPVPAFRQEAGTVAQTDGNVGLITLSAKSLAGYTTISRELAEDTDISALLENSYAKAVAIAWDQAALLGTGVAPNPTGITVNTAVTDKSALGTNGVAFTYDHLIDAVGGVRGRNEQVTGAIMAPRSYQSLGKLKDTQGRYLQKPDYLADVPLLQSGNVPINQTCGTAGNASTLVTGDFRQAMIGVRTDFGVQVFDAPAATTGQLLVVSWMRLDVAIGRGSAFAVRTGLLP